MRYYLKKETYRLTEDGQRDLKESTVFPVNDTEGDALSKAEERFYAQLADEIETSSECCGTNVMEQPDFLHVQTWYLDEACTTQLLKLEITERQMLRNMRFGGNAETDADMRNAVLLHEAIVPNEYADVIMTRQRLYRNAHGLYILETSRKMEQLTIKWESTHHLIALADAQRWMQKYANSWLYRATFGDNLPNDDETLMVVAMPKSTRAQLEQYAKTTGRNAKEIINDALLAYIGQ